MAVHIAVIDGTGAWLNIKYRSDMAHSFCRQIYSQQRTGAIYLRGPWSLGVEVLPAASTAARWLTEQAARDRRARLMLAGYSRGASAAILAAQILRKHELRVDSMFLFDAVARHIYPGGREIPDNVDFSRHAIRTHNRYFRERYEGTIGVGLGNPTRPWFGSIALRPPSKGDHDMKAFFGSHGALGGVGWNSVREDPTCQSAVATWFNSAFRERGLSVCLLSVRP